MTLVQKENENQEIKREMKSRKVDNDINLEVEVVKAGAKFWSDLLKWGINRGILSPMEESVLKIASSFEKTGKIPSAKQCALLLKIKDKAYDEGYYV